MIFTIFFYAFHVPFSLSFFLSLYLSKVIHFLYHLQWFLNDEEVYRLVPEAKRKLQRMVFNQDRLRIDIESSKVK